MFEYLALSSLGQSVDEIILILELFFCISLVENTTDTTMNVLLEIGARFDLRLMLDDFIF